MEQPSWNEARLDDLSRRVDAGFKWMDEKFDRLQLTLITAAAGIIAALIAAPLLPGA